MSENVFFMVLQLGSNRFSSCKMDGLLDSPREIAVNNVFSPAGKFLSYTQVSD